MTCYPNALISPKIRFQFFIKFRFQFHQKFDLNFTKNSISIFHQKFDFNFTKKLISISPKIWFQFHQKFDFNFSSKILFQFHQKFDLNFTKNSISIFHQKFDFNFTENSISISPKIRFLRKKKSSSYRITVEQIVICCIYQLPDRNPFFTVIFFRNLYHKKTHEKDN